MKTKGSEGTGGDNVVPLFPESQQTGASEPMTFAEAEAAGLTPQELKAMVATGRIKDDAEAPLPMHDLGDLRRSVRVSAKGAAGDGDTITTLAQIEAALVSRILGPQKNADSEEDAG